jgi:DMSO/TMAO reductase YedYZ molybdopterin-dependent catalytic subunit
MISPMPPRQRTLLSGLIGIVTALVTLATATVIALVFGLANPFVSVGNFVIDLVPLGFKEFVISLVGTSDKVVLIATLAVLVFIAAVLVGVLQVRRAPWGLVLLLFSCLVTVTAAVTRANATFLDVLPTLVGAFVGVLVLSALVARLDGWRNVTTESAINPGAPVIARRRFLQYAIATGTVSLVVGAGAQLIGGASSAVIAVRHRLKLPTATTTAAPIPADGELKVAGISPYIVPNADFYRIDTALEVPSVDPDSWKLKITGMVENEIELTYAQLIKLPLEEHIVTLTCVSQEVGGNLVGNALWLGYPIRHLLERARPTGGADMVLSTSVDGFTAGTPLPALQDETRAAILAIGMNGQPLPLEHGFPVRMVVPGLYGYVSATKWVVELKVTTYDQDRAYWTDEGWSAKGPVKLSSRIDTPQDGRRLHSGTVAIAGVAWQQHTGIAKVEVQIDGGAWRAARLARVVTVDSWLQWSYAWDAGPGNHRIAVRATNANGVVQTAKEVGPVPNGSSGLHTISVSVA